MLRVRSNMRSRVRMRMEVGKNMRCKKKREERVMRREEEKKKLKWKN